MIRRVLAIAVLSLLFIGFATYAVGRLYYRLDLIDLEDYDPVSTLKVAQHPLRRAKYPFVDVHSHQWFMPVADRSPLVKEMDELNMAVMVNLSGYRGKLLDWSLQNAGEHKGRFLLFVNLDWEQVGKPGWPEDALAQLQQAKDNGAVGLKVFKGLGLTDVDEKGQRIAVDDPRLAPVWEKCGELGLVVLIHSGEPAPFWQPKDRHNERWLELKQEPSRYRDPAKYPSFEAVMAEQHRVFQRHAKTKFIAAHLGWFGNDLERLSALLDAMPNVYTEIGAVLAELGRQPRAARAFLIKHQDRVLFGKDTYKQSEYFTYFRVLETADEYFDYYRKRHAHWKMYGLELPDEVLKKLYYANALNLFPSIDRARFEQH